MRASLLLLAPSAWRRRAGGGSLLPIAPTFSLLRRHVWNETPPPPSPTLAATPTPTPKTPSTPPPSSSSSLLLRRHVWNETTPTPKTPATPPPSSSPQTTTTTTPIARRTDFYDAAVERYAQLPIVRLSLASILRHESPNSFSPPPAERVLASCRHVHSQLPRRLARRLVDLQLLPHVVVSNPHIQRVYHAYAHAFDVLRAFPCPSTLEENARFCALLRRLVDEHAPMLSHLAQGLKEVKARPLLGPALDLDGFLDAMLRSRVSRRLLAEHHLALSARRAAPEAAGGGGVAGLSGAGGHGPSGGGGGGGAAGCVDPALDLREAVEFAAQRTALACLEAYGVAPEVAVVVSTGEGGGGNGGGNGGGGGLGGNGGLGLTTAHLPYVASHLDYMVSEILKNAMRAVSERHLKERAAANAWFSAGKRRRAGAAALPPPPPPPLRPPPPVVVRICAPPGGDVTLRFSDQGGGIDARHEREVWQYGWTSVGGFGGGAGAGGEEDDGRAGFGVGAIGACSSPAAAAGAARHEMAGLGFGLPLTRLYARYFGGELALQNMPGYGVDAFLTLRRLELGAAASAATSAAPASASSAATSAAPASAPSAAAEAEAEALAQAAGWRDGQQPQAEPPLPGDAPQAPGVAAAASAASSVHAAQKDADLSDVRRRRKEKERRARQEQQKQEQEQGAGVAGAAALAPGLLASSDDDDDAQI